MDFITNIAVIARLWAVFPFAGHMYRECVYMCDIAVVISLARSVISLARSLISLLGKSTKKILYNYYELKSVLEPIISNLILW